jgi:hypothetical protein
MKKIRISTSAGGGSENKRFQTVSTDEFSTKNPAQNGGSGNERNLSVFGH